MAHPGRWKLPVALLVVAAAAAAFVFVPQAKVFARGTWAKVAHAIGRGEVAEVPPHQPVVRKPFDGTVEVDPGELETLGIETAAAQPQTEPMRLVVNGRTDYDPNTENKIRPKFKSLIDKVYVEYGQIVQKGDPLVDLFSADLAEAKGGYETKMAQWEYDRNELDRSRNLVKTGAASLKEVKAAENAERKSGTEAKIAKDKLMVFGLSEVEIADVPKEDGTKKAKMTLRAPSSGVVIARNVVQGNIYDENDVLLTVAQLDHFWVYGYIYPSDAGRVSLGQTWVVECQNAGQVHRRTIDSITSEIDKDTKTLVIRTRVDNVGNKLKADMMVSGFLEIPPPTDVVRTVIPRLAMVSSDGGDYVFVRKSGGSAGAREDAGSVRKFERRKIRAIQEGAKTVIVAAGNPPKDGLSPGEEVVTRGALILMQMYDDAATVESGAPR